MKGPADFGDGIGLILVQGRGHLRFSGGQCPWPAAFAAPRSGSGEAGLGALADDVAFELGQRPEDMEDELPAGGGRIDVLGDALEPDLPVCQSPDRFDEVGEGAAQPIQAPDDERIACPDVVESLI